MVIKMIGGIVVLVALTVGGTWQSASAQGFAGAADAQSPVVSLPAFHAEVKSRPIFTTITSGYVSGGNFMGAWGLRDAFRMDNNYFFLDTVVRLQFGRFSLRGVYEPREFVGDSYYLNDPNNPQAEARLDYSGIRVGADIDIAQWNTNRFGFNFDMDLYRPIFTESIHTLGGVKVRASDDAMTLGAHAVYKTVTQYQGVSALFELRARWPINKTELTDFEFSMGAAGPETMLGTLAWKSGYRRTGLEFKDDNRLFEGVFSGWFTELTYYY